MALAALAVVALALMGTAPPPGFAGTPLAFIERPTQDAGSVGLLEQLGPLLVLGLGILIALLSAAAAVILFRTRSAATAAPPSDAWWTCATCSAGNMEGVARCHACGTWRAGKARPTPSASR